MDYLPGVIPLVIFHKHQGWQIGVLILLILVTAFDLWWFFPWWNLGERIEGLSWDDIVMLSRMFLNVALIIASVPITSHLSPKRRVSPISFL